jgi:nitrogen fixation/metabolism regulation signal transduction histidine kinase
MEAGEIVRRIIEENGLPIELMEARIEFDGEDNND